MIQRIFANVVVASFLCLLSSCGPSPQAVLDEFRPKLAELDDKLRAIAAKIPPTAGSVSAKLEPKLVLDPDSPEHNCETIMYPALSGEEPLIDLLLTTNLTTSLYWSKEQPQDGDVEFMRRVLEQGSGARYLVVHRIDETNLPKAVSEDTFVAGVVRIDGFVVDLESLEIVASYSVDAVPDKQVDYYVKENESKLDRLETFARSSLWSNARKQVESNLREHTGGTVKFDD